MICAGPAHLARIAAADRLRHAGVGSPDFDAAELLASVLNVRRGLLPLVKDLDADQASAYDALVRRRVRREPLQHILGSAGFYGLELSVGPGVFIPRPETEVLVAAALQAVSQVESPVVVDLCSGSGAVPVAIARARPDAHVTAVELSADATPWLRGNVERLAPGVHVVEGDSLDRTLPLPKDAHMVTCNPPYVPLGAAVEREVRQHDPGMAVFAGADGLALIRPLVPRIARLLRPGGIMLLEHDDSHQRSVVDIVRASGRYAQVVPLTDLTGRPRFVQARRADENGG